MRPHQGKQPETAGGAPEVGKQAGPTVPPPPGVRGDSAKRDPLVRATEDPGAKSTGRSIRADWSPLLELSRFGGQVTSAFRDSVADRTVVPTECRVKGTIPHAGRLRAAETAAIAGSCTRVAGGGRAARSRRSAKDDRIRGSLRVPRSGGKDRSGPQ